jgi:hypothetical protein
MCDRGSLPQVVCPDATSVVRNTANIVKFSLIATRKSVSPANETLVITIPLMITIERRKVWVRVNV